MGAISMQDIQSIKIVIPWSYIRTLPLFTVWHICMFASLGGDPLEYDIDREVDCH